eukprot:TRINITY_DN11712_c0_g1_i1.p1 TRINITY_DN11712_c0_g1~~TRINITY_DN11712_c0_g1_i1.p1  ORF type:complete len:536 (+),score=57.80 TRINITY_DN11712_c0_g1_i1:240-1847(+)
MELQLIKAEVSKASSFETNNLAPLLNHISELIEVQKAFKQETHARWCELEQGSQALLEEIARIKGDVSACVDVANEDSVAYCDVDANTKVPNCVDASVSITKLDDPHIEQLQMDKSHVQLRESANFRSTVNIKMNDLVHSWQWQAVMNFCICVNVAVMVAELEYEGGILERGPADCEQTFCDDPNNVTRKFFWLATHVFCAIYVADVTTHFLVDGCRFFFCQFNCLDFAVVLVAAMETWVFPLFHVTPFVNTAVLRMCRLGKVVKTIRVLGLMKSCSALRVLLKALTSSVGACVWSIVVIAILVLMGACLLSQLAHNEIPNMPLESRQRILLLSRFGKCSTSMMSTLELTLVSGAYAKYEIMAAVFPEFWAVIILYRLIIGFACMRVIAGLFLKAAIAAASHEAVTSAYNRLLAVMEVKSLHGALTEETLKELLTDPLFHTLLGDLNIKDAQVLELFKAYHPGEEVHTRDFMSEVIQMNVGMSANSNIVMRRQIQSLFSSELLKMQTERVPYVRESHVRQQDARSNTLQVVGLSI